MEKTYLQELALIRERNGGGLLPPEAVVEYAADPNTALHSKFLWDDTEAGHLYRISQAQRLIRVTIDLIPTERGYIEARAYMSLRSDRINGGGYRLVRDIISDEQLMIEAIENLRQDIASLQRKYAAFVKLRPALAKMAKLVPKSKS